MALYSKQVYWPEMKLPAGAFLPEYTDHALLAAEDDRYGRMNLPQVIKYSDYEIFEAEVLNGKVVKVVLCAAYDEKRNIKIVVCPQTRRVYTVWFNLKTDTHATLDRSKYATA